MFVYRGMDIQDCLHDSLLLLTIPEIIAVITGVLSVWFAKKENILVYPVGIVSVLLYVYICLEVKLYADAAINFYYFVMSVYGWYFWKHGGKFQAKENYEPATTIDGELQDNAEQTLINEEAEISFNTLGQNIYYMLAIVFLGGFLGYVLDSYTDSTVPYWDGFTTAIFFIAMVLMAKKKIENWIFWIVGDAMCIPLFLTKGLCFSSLQYLIFTVIAIAGYLSWYKKLQKKFSAS
ncbi:MAG: nicotinamide riboside transporter PnuC [Chitinophagales bacterium]